MSSAQDDVLFGKIALNMHFITKERLEQALNYQKTRAPNQPLGEILLQYRLLTREQIDQVLQFQSRVKTKLTRPGAGPNGAPMSDSWAAFQGMPPGSSPHIPGVPTPPPPYGGASYPSPSQPGMMQPGMAPPGAQPSASF